MSRRESNDEQQAKRQIAAARKIVDGEFGDDLEEFIASWAHDFVVIDLKADGDWIRRKVHIDEAVTPETLV